jgi:CspA family cold shock protein
MRVLGMRTNGIVKWFNDGKGYGFITPEESEKDCFVHYSAIQGEGFRSLKEGERVEFDLVQNDKGPAAENVMRIGQ